MQAGLTDPVHAFSWTVDTGIGVFRPCGVHRVRLVSTFCVAVGCWPFRRGDQVAVS
jgi:hypothetical protein